MTSPLITIIIAVYNGADTLQRCLDSVSGQTYPNREIIVIDGGSTDGTVEILQENDDSISYWESKPDRGIYHAWNKALQHAKGEWVYFLGSDDYLSSDEALSQVSNFFPDAVQNNIKVIYGKTDIISIDGQLIEARGLPWEDIEKDFRTKKMAIPHQGCFHHRSLFDQHGKFDESFSICADYELLLRELKTKNALFANDLTIAKMGDGGVSNSPAFIYKLFKEEIRALKMHGQSRLRPWVIIRFIAYWFAAIIEENAGDKPARIILDIYRSCTGKEKKWST